MRYTLCHGVHLEFGQSHDDIDLHCSTKNGRIGSNKSQSIRMNETKARRFDCLFDGTHGLGPVAKIEKQGGN